MSSNKSRSTTSKRSRSATTNSADPDLLQFVMIYRIIYEQEKKKSKLKWSDFDTIVIKERLRTENKENKERTKKKWKVRKIEFIYFIGNPELQLEHVRKDFEHEKQIKIREKNEYLFTIKNYTPNTGNIGKTGI